MAAFARALSGRVVGGGPSGLTMVALDVSRSRMGPSVEYEAPAGVSELAVYVVATRLGGLDELVDAMLAII